MSSIRLSEGQRKCQKFLWAPAHVCVYSKGLLTWLSQKRSGFRVLIVIPEKNLGPETSGLPGSVPPFQPPFKGVFEEFSVWSEKRLIRLYKTRKIKHTRLVAHQTIEHRMIMLVSQKNSLNLSWILKSYHLFAIRYLWSHRIFFEINISGSPSESFQWNPTEIFRI